MFVFLCLRNESAYFQLNQPWSAPLAVGSYGGLHEAKLREFYIFQRILTGRPYHISNVSGLIEPKDHS